MVELAISTLSCFIVCLVALCRSHGLGAKGKMGIFAVNRSLIFAIYVIVVAIIWIKDKLLSDEADRLVADVNIIVFCVFLCLLFASYLALHDTDSGSDSIWVCSNKLPIFLFVSTNALLVVLYLISSNDDSDNLIAQVRTAVWSAFGVLYVGYLILVYIYFSTYAATFTGFPCTRAMSLVFWYELMPATFLCTCVVLLGAFWRPETEDSNRSALHLTALIAAEQITAVLLYFWITNSGVEEAYGDDDNEECGGVSTPIIPVRRSSGFEYNAFVDAIGTIY